MQAVDVISETVREIMSSEKNRMGLDDPSEPLFDAPLTGYAAGDDPLFSFYKRDIGPFYWTPGEVFAHAFPDMCVLPEELSVISYTLPQTNRTRTEQRAQKDFPSERWLRVYVHGERLNVMIRQELAKRLTDAGFPAVAPVLLPQWGWRKSESYGWASNWSERHTAYIAGLGTFGLCDAIITRKGKAHRLGSLVVRAKLPVKPRPYEGYHDWCRAFPDGDCKGCIRRCPVGAISADGHDKLRCERFLNEVVHPQAAERYGVVFDTHSSGCGLCQVGVPCENGPMGKTD